MPNDEKPPMARHVIWLAAFLAAGIASAWDMHAKPGGWIEVAIGFYVITFMFGSAAWHLVRMLKADRAKQLAERARLKAFDDENQRRRSIEDPNDTPAQ